jgi:hypothetical protein
VIDAHLQEAEHSRRRTPQRRAPEFRQPGVACLNAPWRTIERVDKSSRSIKRTNTQSGSCTQPTTKMLVYFRLRPRFDGVRGATSSRVRHQLARLCARPDVNFRRRSPACTSPKAKRNKISWGYEYAACMQPMVRALSQRKAHLASHYGCATRAWLHSALREVPLADATPV